MRLLKTAIFSILILLFCQAKTQSIQIGNVQSCVGDTVSFPINISNIDTVGAITLYIGYDTTLLNFINLTNINPLASGTLFNDVRSGINGPRLGKIAISWTANSSGVNFISGVFAILKFKVILAGNCPIPFLNNCEIVNYSAQLININYTNGSLAVASMPVILNQPSQLSLTSSQNGFFNVNVTNAYNIQWEIKQGNTWTNIINNTTFQGYDKDTLFVSHPIQSLNGSYVRCRLSNNCFSALSDSVVLNVITSSIEDYEVLDFKIYPNPFCDNISLDALHSVFVEEINIFQLDGRLVQKIAKNCQTTSFLVTPLKELKKGCYFIEIVSKNKEGVRFSSINKLIKN
ncbi:MAG: cohesin domain-containing protein [Bacteroidota bacterium]